MRGKNQKMGSTNRKGKLPKEGNAFNEEMDDEIDAFHKQRDKVPLNMNEDVEESDEDEEQPVFDFQGVNDDEDDDDDDDDDEDEDDPQDTGLAAKIVRQQRYLRAKFGGVEDSMHEDDEDEEETTKVVWGGKKHMYYDADNRDFEIQSSDGDSAKEEEAGVIDQRRERAKDLSMEDFGFEDTSQDGSDRELTLEEISTKGNIGKKIPLKKDATDDIDMAYEEVKKDLNALSREELTDVLMSSAPELVVLLSDLNDAIEQLENKVNPLLNKVKEGKIMVEGGIRYLEFKQLLLLSYCQSITFYLLLKSEGQTVQDHPVVARLLQIKSLLNETIELDGNLPAGLEKIINRSNEMEPVVKIVKKNGTPPSDFFEKDQLPYILPEIPETTESRGNVDTETLEPSKDNKDKREKHKHENGQVGVQSMKMLKIRAALEEKLKQKGVFSSVAPKTDKAQQFLQPLNGQLESYDDFDDEAVNAEREIHQLHNVHASSLISDKNEKRSLNSKVSGVIALNLNKRKVISGDDDIPKSEDLGERRRKHELLLQARAAINSEDDADDETHMVGSDGGASMDEDGGSGDSEDEFYKQIKKEREAKLAAKAEIYSRNPVIPSLPETVDGKRQISYQIEKNRGLTRARKKLIKNPRKKYKLKHQKAVVRRKGQVREVKKPMGPYGGETSGINAGISRSVRFKS